jgi:hypothetical protein
VWRFTNLLAGVRFHQTLGWCSVLTISKLCTVGLVGVKFYQISNIVC